MSTAAHTPHVPERSCVACRRKRPQGELLRLVRGEQGWQLQTGHRTGRGRYVCADTPACWSEKRLRRSFGPQAGTVSALLNVQTPQPAIQDPAMR
ncbi:YlxR family protein [Deinococcus sonorensis]|uniref:YlxR family protein n=2 Tax=Deinococcus sonorensis TaxID=309891 RepID=A0AAU7U9N7_9DEIO